MAVPTTEFRAHQTDIPGLIIFDVTSIDDERGYFQEKYQKVKLVAAGMPQDFQVVQTNVSYNREKGVTRGFHAEPWDKYISVAAGKVFCAFVDLRKETFGKKVTVEIDKNKAVFLPKGVANGFQTIEPETYYIYSVNDHWSQELYDRYTFFNLADPDVGTDWPIKLNNAIISERDRSHPMLKDIKPMDPVRNSGSLQ